jgi:hypothetical protein
VIAEIVTYADYIAFSERLRRANFTEDTGGKTLTCRWHNGALTSGRQLLLLKDIAVCFNNRNGYSRVREPLKIVNKSHSVTSTLSSELVRAFVPAPLASTHFSRFNNAKNRRMGTPEKRPPERRGPSISTINPTEGEVYQIIGNRKSDKSATAAQDTSKKLSH